MKLGRFHLSVRKHILTHLGIEQIARKAAASLMREVSQAKTEVSLWIFLRLDVLGGWNILSTLGHPESRVHCWNSSPFWVPPGMGNVLTMSA